LKPETFKTLIAAGEQYQQAKQNFDNADELHTDKAIVELSLSETKLMLALIEALKEVVSNE
jgi:DNA-binding winged helix-turn-helix (wHTH) protein